MDPEKKEKVEPEVEIVDPPKTDDTIIVETEKKLDESKSQSSQQDLDKIQRRMEYQARQFEKGMQRMEQVAQSFQTQVRPSEPEKPAKELDELDRIAQDDWKKAVKILGKEAAKEQFAEYQAELKKQQDESTKLDQLKLSQQRVLERYPALNDENSEEAQTYMQIVDEDNSLSMNPKGPELAMYRMEERLRESGKMPPDIKRAVDQKVNSETNRRVRVSAGSLPQGRRPEEGNRIVLTTDEKAYCDRMSIPYNRYVSLRNKGEALHKEGVEVE